jgi:CheY-like chemotaxis protein/HPt (histidine-containing phosphotransfer) domain-containing protein
VIEMPPDQQHAANGGRESRPRVLLVADNATERLVLSRHLDRLGAAATAVGDGEEAVEAVRQGGLDAVLIDRGLPGTDGLEVARLIRRLPGGAELPIIVMTADTHQEHRRECLVAGADDYLTKPLEMAKLRDTLQRWLPSPANPGRRLDREALARVRDELDDDKLFAELVTTFLEELPARWAALADAAARGNAAELGAVSHQLAGSAAQVGARRLAVLCDRLHFATGTGARPASLLAAIEVECLALPATLERARELLDFRYGTL